MGKKTLKALNDSIQHWKESAAVKRGIDAKISAFECPLCHLFLKRNCNGCPVRKKTKHKLCYETPYVEATEALDAASADGLEPFKAAALKEVEFLESLLPQPEPKKMEQS